GAEAARLAGATRDQIAAAASAAIAGKCSPRDAGVIVALVTTSAMLRRGADEAERAAPTVSKSARFAAALERARSRAPAASDARPAAGGRRPPPAPGGRMPPPDPRDPPPAPAPRPPPPAAAAREPAAAPADREPPAAAATAASARGRCAPSRSAPLALLLRRD